MNLTAALPIKSQKVSRASLRTIEIRWGTLFIMPWVIGFFLFTIGPMIASLYMSFTDYSILSGRSAQWVGAKNYSSVLSLQVKTLTEPNQEATKVLDREYAELMRFGNVLVGAKDPDFWIALGVTVRFGMLAVPIGMITSLALALLLNAKVFGVRLFRTLIYSPVMVPGIVTAVLFGQLLDRDHGWLNSVLKLVGITGPDWIGRAEWIPFGLVIIGLWTAGGSMLIYLAGLQSIPSELYDAAKVDGANPWRRFWSITLPMLTPVLLYDLILGLIAIFQYFLLPYVLTNGQGGPDKATFFYNLHLYKTAFVFGNMGYASALAWILFAIVLAITFAVFKSSGRWVFYAGGRHS